MTKKSQQMVSSVLSRTIYAIICLGAIMSAYLIISGFME